MDRPLQATGSENTNFKQNSRGLEKADASATNTQLRQLQSYAKGGRGKLLALAGLQKNPKHLPNKISNNAEYMMPPTPAKMPARPDPAIMESRSASPEPPDPDWIRFPSASPPKRKLDLDPLDLFVKRRREVEPASMSHGLRNIGNSCYMNAVLQAVVSIASFSKDMQSGELAHASLPEDSVYKALLEIVRAMKRVDSSVTVNPASLKRSIDKNSSRFQGMRQQDAHEFLCNLLDQIQEDVYIGYEKPRASHSSPKLQLQETACPTTRNFSSIVEHELKCGNCHESSTVQELFRHFSLDIPHREGSGIYSQPPEMQHLLQQFLKDEIYEKTCERCGFDSCMVRRSVKRLPRVLVLHLKRFCVLSDSGGARYTKNTERVHITQTLDLDFCCTSATRRPLASDTPLKDMCFSTPTSVQKPSTPLIDISNVQDRSSRGQSPAETAQARDDPYDFLAEADKEKEDAELRQAIKESMKDHRRSSMGSATEEARQAESLEDRELAEAIARSLQETAAPSGSLREVGGPGYQAFATRGPTSRSAEAHGANEGVPAYIEVDDSGDDLDTGRLGSEGRGKYVLHAIVSHLGSLAFAGHFVTDVFDPMRSQWVRHDDSVVSPVSEGSVFSAQKESEGYIFFYVHHDIASQSKKQTSISPPSTQKPPVRQYSRRTQLAAILSK